MRRKYVSRILHAKPADLVVITLELALDFIRRRDLTKARKAICQLAEALDFRYALSENLYDIYVIIDKKITAGIVNNDLPAVNDAEYLIRLLLKDWKNTAESTVDRLDSGQLKPNVYIGLTYNKKGLCEYAEQDHSAGFKA